MTCLRSLRPSTRRRARAAAALPLVAALVACAPPPGGTLVHSPVVQTAYTPNQVGAFGAAMPVRVVGAPPDGASPEAVAAALRMPARLGGGPLALDQQGRDGQRLVIVFRPSSRLDWCRTPGGGAGASPDGVMKVGLAYCVDDDALTSVVMLSRATAGPGDAGFAPAMGQALRGLLPARDPKDEGRDPDPPIPGT